MRRSHNLINGLIDLTKYLVGDIQNMIEIGCFAGESTQIFLDNLNLDFIYCIDPWEDDWSEISRLKHFNMSEVESIFDSKFSQDNRVLKIKGTIDDFISLNIKTNIDFVYIDGNHDLIDNDIIKVLKYIKPKYIGGHDYDINSFPKIYKCVNELIYKPDKTFIDHSWIIKL